MHTSLPSTIMLSSLLACVAAAPPARDLLFAAMPHPDTMCPTEPPEFSAFDVDAVGPLNAVFDQLTVAEQLSIEAYMATNYGVSTAAYDKAPNSNFTTIAKIAKVFNAKAEVTAYLDGTGPAPVRKAKFWWLKGHERPRVATEYMVTMPITESTVLEEVRTHPWNERPFVYWEYAGDETEALSVLAPLWTDILASVVIGDDMKALAPDAYSDGTYPYVEYTRNGLSVPGSNSTYREELGHTHILAGPEDGWTMGLFKPGPLTYTAHYDFDAEVTVVKDLVWCPGMGNPTFDSPLELLGAFTAGTLLMCEIDGVQYGSTDAYMDPSPSTFLPPDMASKAEPRIYYPDGPRFTMDGRTVSWMGWDLHVDLHGLFGMVVSNLRYQGERIAYEMHATEFSAVYSGASSKKDVFYSDGGYEMGNCATTLKVGLQCPDEAIFLPAMGYDSGYLWGGAMAETDKAICIFEAPKNKALYQHAQMRYEGMPDSSLMVRTVLTVDNYDYTQTFELGLTGDFHWHMELSGYAVGSYVIPDAPASIKSDMFGALLAKSAVGSLHTHSAGYKFDLDIGGTANTFAVKTLNYGPVPEAYAASGEPSIDLAGVAYASPDTYYYKTEKITSEGSWDMDGDMTWTSPDSCVTSTPGSTFVVKSDAVNKFGQPRGYVIDVPLGQYQMLPEGNKYLHLQNFTKCSVLVTQQNDADIEAVSMDVFGNLYPKHAEAGHDVSQFVDGQNLESVDLVLYAHSTKPHWVRTEDVPVPTTMGGPISFSPTNFFDINPFKHMPGVIKEGSTCKVTGK